MLHSIKEKTRNHWASSLLVISQVEVWQLQHAATLWEVLPANLGWEILWQPQHDRSHRHFLLISMATLDIFGYISNWPPLLSRLAGHNMVNTPSTREETSQSPPCFQDLWEFLMLSLIWKLQPFWRGPCPIKFASLFWGSNAYSRYVLGKRAYSLAEEKAIWIWIHNIIYI